MGALLRGTLLQMLFRAGITRTLPAHYPHIIYREFTREFQGNYRHIILTSPHVCNHIALQSPSHCPLDYPHITRTLNQSVKRDIQHVIWGKGVFRF